MLPCLVSPTIRGMRGSLSWFEESSGSFLLLLRTNGSALWSLAGEQWMDHLTSLMANDKFRDAKEGTDLSRTVKKVMEIPVM